nr:glycine receptor subunit alphaZ1-like isoform X1 [Cherax quadricarinatus]
MVVSALEYSGSGGSGGGGVGRAWSLTSIVVSALEYPGNGGGSGGGGVGRGLSLTSIVVSALEYPGSEVIIELHQSMFVSSYCPADLTAFPFDVQLCVVPVALVGHGTPSVDKEHLVITGGGQMLPVFRLLPLRCGFNPVEPMEVLMVMVLERRSEAFLLSAVGPCLVLGLLGHLSFLAFPLNHFSERANTSLSLLIVVAALFSQSVSTLPASASPKAIDVWFFYFILRFFLFFVCHCLVEFQRRRVSASPRHDQHTGRGGGTLEGEKEGMDALFVPGGKAPVEPTSSSSASQKTRTDMCHKRFPNKQLTAGTGDRETDAFY